MLYQPNPIDEAASRAIAGTPKSAADELLWAERKNHVTHKFCISVLTDASGATIPGLTLVFEVKAPIHVNACLYQFTVLKLTHGLRQRAYQLEVLPREKCGHRGLSGAINGPHEHVGEAVYAVDDPTVSCMDWAGCLAWFCTRCNLAKPIIEPPC